VGCRLEAPGCQRPATGSDLTTNTGSGFEAGSRSLGAGSRKPCPQPEADNRQPTVLVSRRNVPVRSFLGVTPMTPTRALLLSLLACVAAWSVDEAGPPIDDHGVLRRVPMGVGWIDVQGELAIPAKGWGRMDRLSASDQVTREGDAAQPGWRASLMERGYLVRETLKRDGDRLTLELVANESGVRVPAIEGVLWTLDLAATAWVGGAWRIDGRSGVLPAEKQVGEKRHLDGAGGKRFELAMPGGGRRLVITVPEPVGATLQDGRQWGDGFTLMLPLAADGKGGWRLTLTIAGEGEADRTPATVNLGAPTGERIDGLGGNWCFELGAPTTAKAKELMPAGWARTEMDISTLAEPPPGAEPAAWAAAAVAALDGKGPEAGHLAATGAFVAKGMPVMTSIWRLPGWMLAQPVKEHGNHILDQRWPWLEAAAVAWLKLARGHGGEPAAFSFNEPDWGVRVKLTPAEQRDAIVRLGKAFAAAGLKTRLAVGDVTNPRDTVSYVQPSVEDPAARPFIACIGVHSWGGASPAQWQAWRAYATTHGLPLIVSEVGPDADAWRGNAFRGRAYQPKEGVHLVGILRDARPQSLLRWEFTGDYDLFDDGRPTMRYAVWRWTLAGLPPGAIHRATTCDRGEVLAASASVGDGVTLLLANAGWGRPVRIAGLAPGAYHLAVSAPESAWSRPADLVVRADGAGIELPADSFAVISSAPLPATWDQPAEAVRR
jgi:hypothetical protein